MHLSPLSLSFSSTVLPLLGLLRLLMLVVWLSARLSAAPVSRPPARSIHPARRPLLPSTLSLPLQITSAQPDAHSHDGQR